MASKTERRSRPAPDAPDAAPLSRKQMQDGVNRLLLDAAEFIPPSKVAATFEDLLGRGQPQAPGGEAQLLTDGMLMATDLVLFTPTASGQTAFDRMARQRTGLDADDAAALAALRRVAFRLLRVEEGGTDSARLRDLATDEVLRVSSTVLGPELAGLSLAARLAPFSDGQHEIVGFGTPLDETAMAAIASFIRPGGRGLSNPQRCAEALYRHVLRHGALRIRGLNHIPDDELQGEISELDHVAARWAKPGAPRTEEDMQAVRGDCGAESVIFMVLSVINTRKAGERALCAAYREIVRVQAETLQRRQAIGSSLPGLDAVAAQIAAEVADGALPPEAADVFKEARQGLGSRNASGGAGNADLDRLIARIQALRAKTVAQGCTEAEALSAAEKVAELLDRYGLSLSELDLKQQPCEGAAVETGRKRVGPVDDCVPAVAAFFDCRVWGEKGADGRLRYVFFGLPADVAAARYLYDLVELAFETETAAFRAGPTYAGAPAGMRRTASNSFGIGLARGIVAKLHTLRLAREGALRGATGRDLVVAKADILDAEMARLGLTLKVRKGPSGRRVMTDAYEEGHEAGLGFEYRPGIADGP